MRRDLKFKMQVRAVQLSMLLMNKNVKNLKKKLPFPSFIISMCQLRLELQNLEFYVRFSVLIEICFGFA